MKDLRTGVYGFIVLSLLSRNGPMHGYALLQAMRSEGQALAPSEGTLYESLKTLEKMGVIESYWSSGGRPRKYYRLTRTGRKVLARLTVQARFLAGVLLKYSSLEVGGDE